MLIKITAIVWMLGAIGVVAVLLWNAARPPADPRPRPWITAIYGVLAGAGVAKFGHDLVVNRHLIEDPSPTIAWLNLIGLLMINSLTLMPILLAPLTFRQAFKPFIDAGKKPTKPRSEKAGRDEPPATRSYQHVAFHVDAADLPRHAANLQAIGAEVRPPRPRIDGEGESLYVHDFDNHLFELHKGTLAQRLARYGAGEEA